MLPAQRIQNALSLVLTMTLAACAAPSDDEPVGAVESHWDAESATNEHASTHLWIVNRAVAALSLHAERPSASAAVAIMSADRCRERWQQGLLDADFKAEFNGGKSDLPLEPNAFQVHSSGATWASHFYDPASGLNYQGAAKPTALTETERHLERAMTDGGARLAHADPSSCYELGLALHYFTDLTQPMHAVNFTALSSPLALHANLEGYAVKIQDRFASTSWSPHAAEGVRELIVRTATDASTRHWRATAKAVATALWAPHRAHVAADPRNTYSAPALDAAIEERPVELLQTFDLDLPSLWRGNRGVDDAIGASLVSAQQRTADFLDLLGSRAQPAPSAH